MKAFLRLFFVALLACISCAAQQTPKDLNTQIERQIRSYYKVPEEIPIAIGSFSSSAEWPNYESFTATVGEGSQKQDIAFLISKDRKSMARVVKFDLSKDPFAEVMKKIDLQGRPVRGAKDSKVTLVVYDDLQCPYCTMMHQSLFPQLLKEYGDRVAFVYKDFPLPNHAWAIHAAVDAGCLATQNPDAYWSFVDYVHANQRDINGEKTMDLRFAALDKVAIQQGQDHKLDATKLQACVQGQNDQAVKASVNTGEAVGVEATPTMFVNGEEIPGGAVPLSRVRAALDRALKANGVPVPQHTASSAPQSN